MFVTMQKVTRKKKRKILLRLVVNLTLKISSHPEPGQKAWKCRDFHNKMPLCLKKKISRTQCVPVFSNPNQKVHVLFHFYIANRHKTDQNQLKKTSVIRFPKITSINMAEKCHQRASYSIENQFFEDYCIGSLISDGFFNWFWSFLCIFAI